MGAVDIAIGAGIGAAAYWGFLEFQKTQGLQLQTQRRQAAMRAMRSKTGTVKTAVIGAGLGPDQSHGIPITAWEIISQEKPLLL